MAADQYEIHDLARLCLNECDHVTPTDSVGKLSGSTVVEALCVSPAFIRWITAEHLTADRRVEIGVRATAFLLLIVSVNQSRRECS